MCDSECEDQLRSEVVRLSLLRLEKCIADIEFEGPAQRVQAAVAGAGDDAGLYLRLAAGVDPDRQEAGQVTAAAEEGDVHHGAGDGVCHQPGEAVISSHCHTVTLSHSHTVKLSHRNTVTQSHCHIFTTSHRHNVKLSHRQTVTQSQCHTVT